VIGCRVAVHWRSVVHSGVVTGFHVESLTHTVRYDNGATRRYRLLERSFWLLDRSLNAEMMHFSIIRLARESSSSSNTSADGGDGIGKKKANGTDGVARSFLRDASDAGYSSDSNTKWSGEIMGTAATFSGLIRSIRIAALASSFFTTTTTTTDDTERSCDEDGNRSCSGTDADEHSVHFELRVLRKGDPLIAPLNRISFAPPGTIFLDNHPPSRTEDGGGTEMENASSSSVSSSSGRNNSNVVFSWKRRQSHRIGESQDERAERGGSASRSRPLRQRKLTFTAILGTTHANATSASEAASLSRPSKVALDAVVTLQRQWRLRRGGRDVTTAKTSATSSHSGGSFEVQLELPRKTVYFSYFPAEDSPIAVAAQMHAEIDDAEIATMSVRVLSERIAACLPSSVELGILQLCAPDAAAADSGGRWRNQMHIGFRLDAMDTQRRWYEAVLCDVRDDEGELLLLIFFFFISLYYI